MTATYHSLGIDKLSTPEQLIILEDIWNHLSESASFTDAHKAELDRRDESPGTAHPAEEVWARLRAGS